MNKFYPLAFLAYIIVCFTVNAQNTPEDSTQNSTSKASLSSGSIESQFDYLNTISNNYQEYKVVKKTNLDKIKGNVLDSLRVFQKEIIEKNSRIQEQQAQIEELNSGIKQAEEERNEALEAKDSFSIFGAYVYKTTYSSIMWGMVIILGLALLFFIYRYSKSFRVIAETQRSLTDTREEFELHRKNTLERERKLKRQLVDEMNKKQGITS